MSPENLFREFIVIDKSVIWPSMYEDFDRIAKIAKYFNDPKISDAIFRTHIEKMANALLASPFFYRLSSKNLLKKKQPQNHPLNT